MIVNDAMQNWWTAIRVSKLAIVFRRVEKFLDLSAPEQRRVVQTAMLVAAFRLGLWIVPYRILRKLAETARHQARSNGGETVQDQIAQTIVKVSRYFPEATCLTQALAAQVLLRREGFDPRLQLGVGRNDTGKFIAHAWVECGGRIIIGGMNGVLPYKMLQSVDQPLRGSSFVIDNGP